MKTLCDSCRKTWCLTEDFKCGLTKNAYALQGKGVESCSRYDNMAIIETEDDGTRRCGLCGKLWTGWDVCPECGADFRIRIGYCNETNEEQLIRWMNKQEANNEGES